MGKKGKRKNAWQNDITFADVKLDKASKNTFDEWAVDLYSDVEKFIMSACQEGYAISLKFDEAHDAYRCSFTMSDRSHHNAGIVCTSHSDNPVEAILLGVYKIYVMYEGVRLPNQADNTWWG